MVAASVPAVSEKGGLEMSGKRSRFCELQITLTVDEASGDYRIHARSPELPRSAVARLPKALAVQALERAQALREGMPTLDDVEALGEVLFEALLPRPVRDAYRYLEGKAAEHSVLRLLLEIGPTELQRLPWECTYDRWRRDWVGRSERSCLVRLVEEQSAVTPRSGRLAVVVAMSRPLDLGPFAAEEEWKQLSAVLKRLEAEGRATLVPTGGGPGEVQEALRAGPDVFHFIGHGGIENGVPGLYLDDGGSGYFLGANDLKNKYFAPLPTGESHLQLVVLSACLTAATPHTEECSSLAYALAGRAAAVVAMQYPVSSEGAGAFDVALYARLAEGMPLDEAISVAAATLIGEKRRDQLDWLAPVVVVTPQATSGSPLWTMTENPFKGPTNYTEKDGRFFHGRDQELATLQGWLNCGAKSVVICGPPACGKTSLLRAGLEARRTESGEPVLYASLDQDIDRRLRYGFERYLRESNLAPLPEGDLVAVLPHVPRKQIVLLDRIEQAEYLGERAKDLVRALIRWVHDETASVREARLLLATRPAGDGGPPAWLRESLPRWRDSLLNLEALDRDEVVEVMQRAARDARVEFAPATCTAILSALDYEHDPDMIKLQVVCRAIYRHADEQKRKQVEPEFLVHLGGVEAILAQEYEVAQKLNEAIYEGGDTARRVLAQFVASDGESMRRRSREQLELRVDVPKDELKRTLELLEDDGLVHGERYQGQDFYELAHEQLVRQIDWLKAPDRKLRKIEELVDGARWLIPRKRKEPDADLGLEDIDAVRERLQTLPDQQQMLLRSALEADHQTAFWFVYVGDRADALKALTDGRLSPEARIRAVPYLWQIAAEDQGSQTSVQARQALRAAALQKDSPVLNEAASRGLARVLEGAEAIELFGRERLGPQALDALAWIYDTRRFQLARLSQADRRQVWRHLLRLTAGERRDAALRAGLVGAAGFAIVAALNLGLHLFYHAHPRPLIIPVLSIILAGLLACLLAAPGAFLAPAVRDWWTVLAGGRRAVSAAAGTLVGCTLGWALTLLVVSSVAQQPQLEGRELLYHVGAGALLGLAIGLSWSATYLLGVAEETLPIGRWLTLSPQVQRVAWILMTGGMGALAVWAALALDWWPDGFYFLAPPLAYEGWIPVAGAIVGIGSTLGLAVGSLERPVPEERLPAGSGGKDS